MQNPQVFLLKWKHDVQKNTHTYEIRDVTHILVEILSIFNRYIAIVCEIIQKSEEHVRLNFFFTTTDVFCDV